MLELIEIAPRDGFQSVKEFIPTAIKKEIIDRLVQAGYKKIQATSFVNPKAIEQMKDAQEVGAYCLQTYPEVSFFALAPNPKGVDKAYETGFREITYVISVTESHNKANVNRSVDTSFAELATVIAKYPDLKINLDVATAFGCPFEGETPLESLVAYVQKGYDIGIRTFDICDTIGVAYPKQVQTVMEHLLKTFPECTFGIHIHDTRNMGMLNTYVAIKSGINRIFSVCSGLGGCPFAPGASGNTASEDLVNMLEKNGYCTGIDHDLLVDAAKFMYQSIPTGIFSSHFIHIKNAGCQYYQEIV